MRRAPTLAAIITVGNELLFGETVDTNAAWLGRVLTEWGIEVVGHTTTRDRADEIQAAVRMALSSADLVIVSGGLGPTPDDVTKGAVAALLGLELTVDSRVAEAVRARFAAGGIAEVPGLSQGQAEVPAEARVLMNERGTAPGLLLGYEGSEIVLLPGVPGELHGIVLGPLHRAWEESGIVRADVHHRVIHTTGVEEPSLAESVEACLDDVPLLWQERVDVAYLPDEGGVDVRLTVRGASPAEAAEAFAAVELAIGGALAPYRFEAEAGDLAGAVLAELARRQMTMAAAESCTGGLIAKRMTDRAGASDVFHGGVVAYDNAVKTGLLGVSPADLEQHGAVSETVARQMAVGVAEKLGTDCGVGITGIAGPGGGSEEKPVGTVWIALTVGGRQTSALYRFPGDRGEIRRRAAQAALALLYRELSGDHSRA